MEKIRGDVLWIDCIHKKLIAGSTKAASDLIALLCNDYGYKTPNEIIKHITYDEEAKAVMQAFIDEGLGDVELRVE